MENNLLSVSVKISTLELSPRMLQAWDLDPDMYIVLLIRLQSLYRGYEDLLLSNSDQLGLSFRIGKCRRYKPSCGQGMAFFASPGDQTVASSNGKQTEVDGDLSKIMVSNSLGEFMSRFFLPVTRWRHKNACSWADAVDAVVKPTDGQQPLVLSEPRPMKQNEEKSFPLVAMEFALDRLVHWTEYCQSCCHTLSSKAICLKPSLCPQTEATAEHTALGMQRLAECEILTQPNVVDLLVSLCYKTMSSLNDANNPKTVPIRQFPTAMPLKALSSGCLFTGNYVPSNGHDAFIAAYSSLEVATFCRGQWVAFSAMETNALGCTLFHAVVTDIDSKSQNLFLHHPHKALPRDSFQVRSIYTYSLDFDKVSDRYKASALKHILDSLPAVADVKSELEKPTVYGLQDVPGVSPSAALLLGWIVAMNPSCIVQTRNSRLQVLEGTSVASSTAPSGWVQFCFLQRSPEADSLFESELSRVIGENRARQPSRVLFGWHGSNVSNWQSILRSGLNYDRTVNGRSYGNGVYFSHHFDVSLKFAKASSARWPQAALGLGSVLSLNEIINAPHKFVQSYPHYVVAQRGWSRIRFLFVSDVRFQVSSLPFFAPLKLTPSKGQARWQRSSCHNCGTASRPCASYVCRHRLCSYTRFTCHRALQNVALGARWSNGMRICGLESLNARFKASEGLASHRHRYDADGRGDGLGRPSISSRRAVPEERCTQKRRYQGKELHGPDYLYEEAEDQERDCICARHTRLLFHQDAANTHIADSAHTAEPDLENNVAGTAVQRRAGAAKQNAAG